MEDNEIIFWNIEEAKQRIKKAILKDKIIIFFTRILEDLKKYKNPNFYGRVKEIHHLIFPFSLETNPKEIIQKMKKANFNLSEGLTLDNQEIESLKFFIENLDEKCKLKNEPGIKGEIEKRYAKIIAKYLPNSIKLLEPFLVGKLISSLGGIKKISRKPSSTIQLIGAEKALFRHMAKNTPSPKHGLIFYSNKLKNSVKKGKDARVLANKLAIALREDYYQNFPQPLS